MTTYLLPLLGDAGPNDGLPFPASPATHFDKVSENPHDSDTTRIRQVFVGAIEAFSMDVSAIPDDEPILSVAVRWAQAGDSDSSAHSGFRIGGAYYTSLSRGLPVNMYATFNETPLLMNPATGLPWTKQVIAAMQIIHQQDTMQLEVGYPRLTQLVPIVITGDPVRKPSADPASLASDADIIGLDPIGAPVSLAPVSVPIALAPDAVDSSRAPTAKPVAIVYASDPASIAPMATDSNFHELSATPASMAPIAASMESRAEEADGIPLAPSGDDL